MRSYAVGLGLSIVSILCAAASVGAEVYRSPQAVAVSPDGQRLYAADRTASCIALVDIASGKWVSDFALPVAPAGIALSVDGTTLYAALRTAGKVAVIDAQSGVIRKEIEVGPWPVAVTLGEKTNRLYTCNRGDHSVTAVELSTGKILGRVAVVRDPFAAALTPDESRLVVTNYMPAGAGTDPALAAEVSLIDTVKMELSARVKMPPGTTMLGGVCVSPDGLWAYAVHAVGRFLMPITQLERGWVHTYAVSVIDLTSGTRAATLLLDDMTGGAADPWDIAASHDGKTLFISHAGIHEISLVDIGKIHELLQGKLPKDLAELKDGERDNIWVRIRDDRQKTDLLTNDITALRMAGAIRRVSSGGKGPRGLALSKDGARLYAANYFSGSIGAIDTASGSLVGTILIAGQPPANAARKGEFYFHDATRCFQQWHSCASCHLDDGRTDGLPWDFLRDGVGNGKDVISLIGMMDTSPHNRRGTRPNPRECMRTGVTGSHMIVPKPEDVEDLLAYVASLKAEPNPNLPKLADAAVRGKRLFEGKAACSACHPTPLFTDQMMHNVGILTSNEPDGRYDTPSLVDCWRTAPYFHDGRAATLEDALNGHGTSGQHGNAKDLSAEELVDLLAYLQML